MFKRTAVPPARPSEHQARQPLNMALDVMEIFEYDPSYRTSAVELMALLQEHERRLCSDRPPSTEVSEAQLDYLVRTCEACEGRIFLAVVNERTAGLIVVVVDHVHEGTQHVYSKHRKFGLITDFVVAEAYRGTAIAAALMVRAEEYCLKQGLSSVRLSVLRANGVARRFYEKSGYFEYEIVYRKDI